MQEGLASPSKLSRARVSATLLGDPHLGSPIGLVEPQEGKHVKSKPPARRRRTGWTTCAPSGHGSTSTPVKTETHCETNKFAGARRESSWGGDTEA